MAEGPEGDEIDPVAQGGARQGGEQGPQQEGQAERDRQAVGDDGAQHEHRRVGQVEDVQDPEDQRVAHGEEGVDAAGEDAVQRLGQQRGGDPRGKRHGHSGSSSGHPCSLDSLSYGCTVSTSVNPPAPSMATT